MPSTQPKQPSSKQNRRSFFSWLPFSTPWLLAAAIVATGVLTVNQVQIYRNSFTEAEALRREQKRLNTEWHKLLIEQQTFGATTQIGGRAVVSMGMYSPKPNEIVTLDVPPKTRGVVVEKPELSHTLNDDVSTQTER